MDAVNLKATGMTYAAGTTTFASNVVANNLYSNGAITSTGNVSIAYGSHLYCNSLTTISGADAINIGELFQPVFIGGALYFPYSPSGFVSQW